MLPLLQAINEKMESYIKDHTKSDEDIELKEIMGKFSMDALASCAFGVDSGTFANQNSESEFVKHAKIIFDFANPWQIFQFLTALFTPKMVKQFFSKIGFKNIATVPALKSQEFLQNVVEASIKQRRESKTTRNDLVDMMIDALEDKLDITEDDAYANDQYEKDSKLIGHVKKTKSVTYDHVISTATVMLVAGYDTTATTMSYILYELALNQDCQETLFEEIENAKNGRLTYDTIQSLPYLEAVIHETLRRHPVVSVLERPCTKEYKMPDTNLIIRKGDLVRVNNIGICFDPDIFPNPEEWNPDNFTKENRADRNPYSFMAFSLGPRNCLAMRFAMFEMKVCISHLVSKLKILSTAKTCKNVQVDPRQLLGGAKGGLWIRFEER